MKALFSSFLCILRTATGTISLPTTILFRRGFQPKLETIWGSKNTAIRIKRHNVGNGSSYLGLASRAEELNVGENSQAELDASARAGFTTLESTESDVTIHLANAWIAIDWLSIKWKSDLLDWIKWDFFQAVSILCGKRKFFLGYSSSLGFWFLYLTPLVSSYPILIRTRFLVCRRLQNNSWMEGKKETIPFNF